MASFSNFFKKSVSFKIFLVTSVMLVAATAIMYGVILFIMPYYYKAYKKSEIDEGATVLVENAQKYTLAEYSDELEEFAVEYNVNFRIYDSNDNVVYEPNKFIELEENDYLPPEDQSEDLDMYEYTNKAEEAYVLSFKTPIVFTDGSYTMIGSTTLQPIIDVSKILIQLLPYFVIIVVILAIVTGLILSRMISRPLVQMNKAARKMAELDFSVKIPETSDDEIGELSRRFNEMSRNLETVMTELQNANEYLKEDIEKKQKIEEQRREFVATISHELKSPITAVKGQLEGMIYGIGAYKDTDKYLKKSFSKLEEMEQLVKEMLEVSRLDRPDFNPASQRVKLDKLVNSIISKNEFFISDKRMDLRVEVLENVVVSSDENLLGKVVQNVIYNAIMYSPEEASVNVHLEDDVDQYVLTVTNSGVQIDEKDLETLFDPFVRLDKSRNRNSGGSGLGLYIVKRFLGTLGHQFEMTSNDNHVQFTIYFKKTA